MSQLQLNMEEKVIQTKFSCRAYTSKYCIIRVINKILRSRGGSPICQPRAWLRTELDVLLRINYNRYDFRTQQIHLSQISPLEKKTSPFQKFLRFFRISGYCAVDYFVPKKKDCLTCGALRFSIRFASPALYEISRNTWRKNGAIRKYIQQYYTPKRLRRYM